MLKAEGIRIGFKGKALKAGPISMEIGSGELILLCGANGSGKTTLLKTLAGILPPVEGKISMVGKAAMTPTGIPRVKGFTVSEFISTSCYTLSRWDGRLSPQEKERLGEALRLMGLEDLKDRDISKISDGEFQKATIATALTRDASLILLDEPTAFLDVDNRAAVLEALEGICSKTGKSVIFSSHDIAESAAEASRIIGFDPEGGFHDSASSGKGGPEDKTMVIKSCFQKKFHYI